MKKRTYLIAIIFYWSLFCFSQSPKNEIYSVGFETKGFLSSDELPFWAYSNSFGNLSENSNGLVYAFAKANYFLGPKASLEVKASGLLRDGIDPSAQRGEIYVNFKNSWLEAVVGSQKFTNDAYELSSTRRNILFSSNTRALPGLLLKNRKPLTIVKDVSLYGAIAHYQLNDNRFVENVRIHYKNLYVNWEINKNSSLKAGLQHAAQWGGISREIGEQPGRIGDFAKIFFGRGGGDFASFNDQVNALGNHIGSYDLTYSNRKSKVISFELYYQSLFEDRSGRELNNFPDGVWGISIQPKESKLFKEFLYEYVQTVSQSGRPRLTQNGGQQSGGDNYFTNSIYRSGWTYEGRTIGLPFISIFQNSDGIDPATNNRSIAHHLGVLGNIKKVHYTLKLTFLENLGTYAVARIPKEKFVYSYFKATLPTQKLGDFNLEIGADLRNTSDNLFAAGLGYIYNFDF